MPKRVAIYTRVSTDTQTTENQRRELEAMAQRCKWEIIAVFEDAGSAERRPGDRLQYSASRGPSGSLRCARWRLCARGALRPAGPSPPSSVPPPAQHHGGRAVDAFLVSFGGAASAATRAAHASRRGRPHLLHSSAQFVESRSPCLGANPRSGRARDGSNMPTRGMGLGR
ncbi:MAG: recombinase family protein [Alphaproteobacteria bacterium]|nr:recombinase family protein [Alphaproteobacteria bacterium]